MTANGRRIRAIVRKEHREYRRNRSIVLTMAVLPLIFLIEPMVSVRLLTSSDASQLHHTHVLLYMLAIPALVPAAIAAASIVGERQQGTLEPILTTPISREELVVAKALAPLVPAIMVSYAVYAFYLAYVEAVAHPGVAAALIRTSDIVVQVVFTPLIAGVSIWIAIGISARSSDVRVAQQLSMLASLPSVAVTSLISFDVIHPTIGLALALGAALLAANRLGWRIVSAALDRERLIAGSR
jgi:ABC-type Na+ efflux pump permease subunit